MRQPEPVRDVEAFTEFYRENYARIVAYVRRRSTIDPHAVASDVFTVAWQRYDMAFRGGLPWLYRTAHFQLRNAQRATTRRQRLELKLASSTDEVADATAEAVDRVLVGTLLDQLSEADREVLMLVYWEDLDHRAVGAALGCSTTAAAVRAHRARRRFARLLATTSTAETARSRVAPSSARTGRSR